ncbi:MAG: efflux transporter outer membrane subunit [Desulfobacter sp.]|nr:MAG: efflux transporter outer membrane subunit [Desulfobacter sp.]
MIRILCTATCLFVCLISGCKTMGPESAAGLPVQMPDAYANQIIAGEEGRLTAIRDWWTALGSDELNGMVKQGLADNYDLKIKQARIDQAAASLKKEKAALAPGLDFSLGGSRKHTRTKTRGSSAVEDGSHSWDGRLSAAYTPDIWGEAGAAVQAADLALEAARQDYNAAALDLTADIAETWANIISVGRRLEILHSQIEVNTTHLDLQKLRFLNGKASALDVSQQRESLAQALSAVPLLEKEEKELVNKLGFLLGATPGQPVMVKTHAFPEMAGPADPGIPAALLENRPDIRAARVRLLAARSEVAAARADLMPSLTLTASALFSSGSLDLLFQNWVASLAASLAGPIFDGGKRQAEVERTRAVVKENLNLYAKTVSQALQEVEDSLVGIDRQAAYIQRLEEELEAARLTLIDARVQYLNGQSSYLSYLTAWSAIERLERQLVSEQAGLVKERITLQRAMGWQAAETDGADNND